MVDLAVFYFSNVFVCTSLTQLGIPLQSNVILHVCNRLSGISLDGHVNKAKQ